MGLSIWIKSSILEKIMFFETRIIRQKSLIVRVYFYTLNIDTKRQ